MPIPPPSKITVRASILKQFAMVSARQTYVRVLLRLAEQLQYNVKNKIFLKLYDSCIMCFNNIYLCAFF